MGRLLGQIAVPVALLAVLAIVCVRHAEDVGKALEAVPAWAVAAAVGLHVLALVMRSEAWGLSIAAIDGRPLSRRIVHRANGAAFLAGALQSQAALPARVGMLRRLAGERAPRPGQIAVADVPIFAAELLLTAALLVVGVASGLGAWWTAPASLGLAVAVLVALLWMRRRFAHRPLAAGLAVLADRGRRGRLLGFATGICAATVVRIWLVLVVCGLPHSAGEVGWLFAALGAFGLLPAGPGAPAGATLATLGAGDIGAAVAAGLVLSATSIGAVVVYGALVTAVFSRRRDRPEVRRAAVEVERAEAGEVAMGRAVEVGGTGRDEVALGGEAGEQQRLVTGVRRVERLDAVQAGCGEPRERLADLGLAAEVPERVRPDRDAAGGVDGVHGLGDRRALAAAVRGTAGHEIGLQEG